MRTTGATDAQSGVDRIRTDFLVEDQETTASRIKAASREGIDHTNRDAFGLRLQQQYHQYAVNETPFLLIAMRGEG